MEPEDQDPLDSDLPKVRRSVFLPEGLEQKLAKLASARQTSPNDLICEILTAAVAAQEDAEKERTG